MSQLLSSALVPSLLCCVTSSLHSPGVFFTPESIVLQVSYFSFPSFHPIKRAAGLTPPSTQAWEYSTWRCFQRLFFCFCFSLSSLQREKQKGLVQNIVFLSSETLSDVTGEKQCAQGLKEMAWLPSVPSHPGRNFSFHCYTGCYSLKMLLFSSEIMWARQGDVTDSHSAEPKRRR